MHVKQCDMVARTCQDTPVDLIIRRFISISKNVDYSYLDTNIDIHYMIFYVYNIDSYV